MSWQVLLSNEAEKNVKKLPKNIVENVKNAIREIVIDPLAAGKALQGAFKGYHSFRIGDYRIIYMPIQKTKTIYVAYIRHRREAYR